MMAMMMPSSFGNDLVSCFTLSFFDSSCAASINHAGYIQCGRNKLKYKDTLLEPQKHSTFSPGFCTIVWLLDNFPHHSIHGFGMNGRRHQNGHNLEYERGLLEQMAPEARFTLVSHPRLEQQQQQQQLEEKWN